MTVLRPFNYREPPSQPVVEEKKEKRQRPKERPIEEIGRLLYLLFGATLTLAAVIALAQGWQPLWTTAALYLGVTVLIEASKLLWKIGEERRDWNG